MEKDLGNEVKAYIAPDILLRLLINIDDRQDEIDMLAREDLQLVTSQFALYEAVASTEIDDRFDHKMLILILRRVLIQDNAESDFEPLYKMKEERRQKLRKLALGEKNG